VLRLKEEGDIKERIIKETLLRRKEETKGE
jgi:hypothetical protein